MDKVTAKIRSKVGDFTITFYGPSGVPKPFHFSKANNFTMDIPKEIIYTDHLGRKKVAAENYPMDLLKGYPNQLELVEVTESPSIATPVAEKAGVSIELDN